MIKFGHNYMVNKDAVTHFYEEDGVLVLVINGETLISREFAQTSRKEIDKAFSKFSEAFNNLLKFQELDVSDFIGAGGKVEQESLEEEEEGEED